MVQEGIVLWHKISKKEIEVDKAKIEVIEQLPPPTSVKGICSFLGHAREFIVFWDNFRRPPFRISLGLLDPSRIF
jgi:hypothetical protein